MIVLALHYNEGALPLREIAERENISFQFLEQIFPKLRRSGLVNSIRGMRGGYMLARSPTEIYVGDIIRALEGPIAPVYCLAEEKNDKRRCSRKGDCFARQVWEKLRDRIDELLNQISLEDMIKGNLLC